MTEPLPPMSEEEIEQLAVEIVTNVVYFPVEEHAVRDSFGMIAALAGDQFPTDAAFVYEYWDKAGPLAVNGHPTFFSCKFVPKVNAEALMKTLQAKHEALYGKAEPS